MKRFLATVHVHAQALAFFVTNIDDGGGIHGVQQQRGRDQPNAETIRGRHDVPAAAAAMAERKAKRVKRTGTRSTRGRGHRRRETRGTVCGRQWKRSDVVQPLSRMTTIHARNPRRDAKKRRFVNAFGPGIGTVPVTDDSPRRRTTAVVRPPRRVECRRFS